MNALVPLFEDNHLLVLNKPAGLLTQPTPQQPDSLEERAKAWLKIKYAKPGQVFLSAVHRLDKPVSGVVVLGKTSKGVARLNASMRTKNTNKVYWAWVEGELPYSDGVLEHDLVHGDFMAHVAQKGNLDAKRARLTYRVLEQWKEWSLVEITLDTGRYHQIRAQLSAVDCPIWGDHKYGSRSNFAPDAIALHHVRLEIPHPITGRLLNFHAPVPAKFHPAQAKRYTQ